MDKQHKKQVNIPKHSKPLLFIAMAVSLIGVAPGAYAGIQEFNAGMVNSGTGPFETDDNPGHDSSLENDIIRSADTATYRVAYSLDGLDTGSLITLDLTNKVVFPAGYTQWHGSASTRCHLSIGQ